MRNKSIQVGVILLSCFGLMEANAQTLLVRQVDNSIVSYALSDIIKLNFSSGNLIVTEVDRSEDLYELDRLRYLNFTDLLTDVQHGASEYQSLSTYPNPVGDLLNVQISGLVNQGATIEILSLEGVVLLTDYVKEADILSLDTNSLPQGIYLCRYTNGADVKTIKIIKQ